MAAIKIENLNDSENPVSCSKKLELGDRERRIKKHFLQPGESALMRVSASTDPDAPDRSVIISNKKNPFSQ
jgi:hypothetical protein